MKKLIFILFLMPSLADAEVIETWACTKNSYSNTTLATAYVNKGRKTGEITVAGVTHKTAFKVKGFERRWDFGDLTEASLRNYAFVLEPNGDATYYDFSTAKPNEGILPSMRMHCKMK